MMDESSVDMKAGILDADESSNDSQLYSNSTKKRIRKLKQTWNKEQTEQLINLIRVRECLWNDASAEYKDREGRSMLWKEIAAEMQMPREEVTTKWNSIRCSFRAAFNRQTSFKSRANAPPLYKSLTFLVPTLRAKVPTTMDGKNHLSSRPASSLDAYDHDDDPLHFSQPSATHKQCKRMRQTADDDYGKVLELSRESFVAHNAIPREEHATVQRDIWQDIGNFVATNGQEWAKTNAQLANEFKTAIYKTIAEFQQKTEI